MTVTVLHPGTPAGTPAHGELTRYKNGPDEHGTPGKGCRCPSCRTANREYGRHRDRMIAYSRWEPLTDATGTRRRLQALIWNGWSFTALAARLGCSRQALQCWLARARVTPAVAGKVSALYDDLWDQPPPDRTRYEKTAVTMARRHARENGFAPPAAWDDDEIDDPAATPAEGWERRDETRRYGGELAEEAADLLGWGEHPDMAAQRLGVSRGTLDQSLRRAQRRAEASRAA